MTSSCRAVLRRKKKEKNYTITGKNPKFVYYNRHIFTATSCAHYFVSIIRLSH